MNTPFDDTLQSLFDSSLSAVPETPTFGQDFHTSSPFDDSHSFAQTYQTEHFSQENHWNNAAFHSAPEHSLNQDIDSLLNGSDSSDDSNNLNATNFTMPTFQHLPLYHAPHEHFHAPPDWEREHEMDRAFSSPESSSEAHHVLRSEVHHYHHIVRPNPTTDGGDGSSDDNSCSIDGNSSSGTGGCADANGDGVCDSAGSSNDD